MDLRLAYTPLIKEAHSSCTFDLKAFIWSMEAQKTHPKSMNRMNRQPLGHLLGRSRPFTFENIQIGYEMPSNLEKKVINFPGDYENRRPRIGEVGRKMSQKGETDILEWVFSEPEN